MVLPSAPTDVLLSRYRAMLRIRLFERTVERLLAEGRIGGTTHLCIGQEAAAVGTCAALAPEDLVVSTHRGHGHLLAKGGDPRTFMAELWGRRSGYCQGKGGSQHTAAVAIGFMGSNGITGGGIPIATGLALACTMQRRPLVVACFFGDGACSTGNFHESLNMAALWRLPVVYVCENNLYAMSNPLAEAVATRSLVDWAARYEGVAAAGVDGNDVVAVEQAVSELAARARAGGGPGFLECRTYRQCGHSRSDVRGYRTREEEQAWAEADPIARVRALLAAGMTEAALTAVDAAVAAEIDEAVRFAMEDEPGGLDVALSGAFAFDD